MRLKNDLTIITDPSLDECTVILSNFYQEPKMQTLSIEFNDVQILLRNKQNEIEEAIAFCHQDLKINNILNIDDISSYNCFTFNSDEMLFLKLNNSIRSGEWQRKK